MSGESNMRSRRVIPALRDLDAVAVENPACPGTPDVNCTAGWLELKSLDAWPKKPETPVVVDHFTPQQKVWLVRRCSAGGRAYLLLKVNQDWLLFLGTEAARILGRATQGELRAAALRSWKGRRFDEEIAACLSRLAS